MDTNNTEKKTAKEKLQAAEEAVKELHKHCIDNGLICAIMVGCNKDPEVDTDIEEGDFGMTLAVTGNTKTVLYMIEGAQKSIVMNAIGG